MKEETSREEVLKILFYEFDENFGDTLCIMETLKNIETELGIIYINVSETDMSSLNEMGMTFYDLYHRILMSAELFRYTIKDLEKTIEKTQTLKDGFFDIIVKNKV